MRRGYSYRISSSRLSMKAADISELTNDTPMRLASSGGHRCARTWSSTVGHAISARLTTSLPPYSMDDSFPVLTPTKHTNP